MASSSLHLRPYGTRPETGVEGPSAPKPALCSRPERAVAPWVGLCPEEAQCGYHLASGVVQAPKKHGEAGTHCGLLLLGEASAEPAPWSSRHGLVSKSETSSLGYRVLCCHFQWTQLFLTHPLSPVRTRETPCTVPIPASCPLLLCPVKDARGLELTPSPPVLLFLPVIRSLLVTCPPLIVSTASPPPPPRPASSVLITAIIYYVNFRCSLAFLGLLPSGLIMTLFDRYCSDPHLGVSETEAQRR